MYFVAEITTKDEQTAKALFDFPSIEAAKAHFFSFLASAYSDPGVTYILAEILDESGNLMQSEVFGV